MKQTMCKVQEVAVSVAVVQAAPIITHSGSCAARSCMKHTFFCQTQRKQAEPIMVNGFCRAQSGFRLQTDRGFHSEQKSPLIPVPGAGLNSHNLRSFTSLGRFHISTMAHFQIIGSLHLLSLFSLTLKSLVVLAALRVSTFTLDGIG